VNKALLRMQKLTQTDLEKHQALVNECRARVVEAQEAVERLRITAEDARKAATGRNPHTRLPILDAPIPSQ
jgi:hypothetical protein